MESNRRWALVCGASQGIGRAVAQSLSEQNWNVALLARNESELNRLAQTLKTETYIWVQDLNDHTGLREGAQRLLKKVGAVSALINNSAGPKGGPLLLAEASELENALRTHVMAAHILTQAMAVGMKEQKFGRIINVISTSVKAPIPNLGVSNTIRGAMANWAKTMSLELGPFGITVNNVLPGYTKTDRLMALKSASAERDGVSPQTIEQNWLKTIPGGRFAEPREIAEAVAFLASEKASYISGINLPVDGGRTASL